MYVGIFAIVYLIAFITVEVVMIIGADHHYKMNSYTGFYLYSACAIAIFGLGIYNARKILDHIKN